MARGWESKAVEDQQADAARQRTHGPALTEAERERRARLDALRLSLADLTAQLQAACRPVHRDMLQRRIAAVEQLIARTQGS